MGILDKLRTFTAKTPAAEIAVTIPELRAARDAAAARLVELEAGREHAIFTGGDLDRLTRDIAAQRIQVENFDIAIAGAERRQHDAEAREHRAAVEATMARGAALRDESIALRKALHPHVVEVVAGVARLRAIAAEVVALNHFAEAEDRPDLVVRMPPNREWHEAVRLGRIAEVHARKPDAPVPDNYREGSAMGMPLAEGPTFNVPGYPVPKPVAGGETPRSPAPWPEHVFPELARDT